MSHHASPVLKFLRGVVSAVEASDGELLRRFALGCDEAAFAALVQRHGPTVFTACKRVLRQHHDAEDAFQATFLVLARRAASVGKPDLLGNWLYGVAHRVAMKARSEAARRRSKEARCVREETITDPEVGGSEVASVLDEEVNRLPERFRRPFVLCHLLGKTNDEAARLIGCPKGTVLSRLSTARQKLRTRLVRRGVAPAALATAALTGAAASASVPPLLTDSTVRSALASAAGLSTAGLTPVRAARWAAGELRAMFLSKLRLVAVAVLVLAGVTAGLGVVSPRGPDVTASDTLREPSPKTPPTAPPAEDAEDPGPPIKNARVMDILLDVDTDKGTITYAPGFKEQMVGYVGPIEERQKKLKDKVEAAGKKPKTARVAPGAELRIVFRQSPSVANSLERQLSEFEKCKYLYATIELAEAEDEVVTKLTVWR